MWPYLTILLYHFLVILVWPIDRISQPCHPPQSPFIYLTVTHMHRTAAPLLAILVLRQASASIVAHHLRYCLSLLFPSWRPSISTHAKILNLRPRDRRTLDLHPSLFTISEGVIHVQSACNLLQSARLCPRISSKTPIPVKHSIVFWTSKMGNHHSPYPVPLS